MFKKLLRGILTLVGLSLGYIIGESILKIESFKNIKNLSSSVLISFELRFLPEKFAKAIVENSSVCKELTKPINLL